MAKVSPLFTAALDAHRAAETMLEKLRNVRGRDLSSGEVYAIGLVRGRLDEVEDLLEARLIRSAPR